MSMFRLRVTGGRLSQVQSVFFGGGNSRQIKGGAGAPRGMRTGEGDGENGLNDRKKGCACLHKSGCPAQL